MAAARELTGNQQHLLTLLREAAVPLGAYELMENAGFKAPVNLARRGQNVLTRSYGGAWLSFRAIMSAEIRGHIQHENRENPRVSCAEKQKAAEAAFAL